MQLKLVKPEDKVGEGFAGTGPGRQHIAVAALSGMDRILLMLVQAHCFANVLRRLVSSKNAAAFFVQEPYIHEVFNRAAWDEIRIELDKGSGPEFLGAVFRVHELRNI